MISWNTDIPEKMYVHRNESCTRKSKLFTWAGCKLTKRFSINFKPLCSPLLSLSLSLSLFFFWGGARAGRAPAWIRAWLHLSKQIKHYTLKIEVLIGAHWVKIPNPCETCLSPTREWGRPRSSNYNLVLLWYLAPVTSCDEVRTITPLLGKCTPLNFIYFLYRFYFEG